MDHDVRIVRDVGLAIYEDVRDWSEDSVMRIIQIIVVEC